MKKYVLIILLIISGLEPVVANQAFAGKQPVDLFFFQQDLISIGAEELTADGNLPDEEPFCYLSYTLHQNSKVELFIADCNKLLRGFLNNPFSPPEAI